MICWVVFYPKFPCNSVKVRVVNFYFFRKSCFCQGVRVCKIDRFLYLNAMFYFNFSNHIISFSTFIFILNKTPAINPV